MSKHRKRKRPANKGTSGARNKAIQLASLVEQGKPFRWAPGQSGNPNGRPPAVFAQACRAKLAETVPGDPLQRTFAVYFADLLAAKGMHGDQQAIAEICDRAEGRPRVGLDIGTGEADPLTLLCQEMKKMSEQIGPPEGQTRDENKKETVQ